MDNELLYNGNKNQACCSYSSLYFYIPSFQGEFVSQFSRNCVSYDL